MYAERNESIFALEPVDESRPLSIEAWDEGRDDPRFKAVDQALRFIVVRVTFKPDAEFALRGPLRKIEDCPTEAIAFLHLKEATRVLKVESAIGDRATEFIRESRFEAPLCGIDLDSQDAPCANSEVRRIACLDLRERARRHRIKCPSQKGEGSGAKEKNGKMKSGNARCVYPSVRVIFLSGRPTVGCPRGGNGERDEVKGEAEKR